MSVKRSAENEVKETDFYSHEHKKNKTKNSCSRCSIELSENYMKARAGDFCPNCYVEVKKEWMDASNNPTYCVELKETFAENPVFIPFPPKDDSDYDLIYMTCVLMNLNVTDFIPEDESDDDEIENDQNQEETIEKEGRKDSTPKAPQG